MRIFFDVPAGLASYSGIQPVTFGVPFERGALRKSDGLRVVDATGQTLPAQFEVTATWAPGSDEVRWLLVDLLVEIERGRAPEVFLEYGRDAPAEGVPSALRAVASRGQITVDTGVRRFTLGRESAFPGAFTLIDGTGRTYRAGDGNSRFEAVLEKSGPVRAVVKITGDYAADNGSRIAEFVTRVRFYAGCPFVRVYHTMIWQTDASVQIGELAFHTEAASGDAVAGLDGTRVGPLPDLSLSQIDWNTVKGIREGTHLDGWIQISGGQETIFAALRWPWQQFPTGVEASGGAAHIRLIGPERPMSLAAEDVAVDYVKPDMETWNLRIFGEKDPWHEAYNGPAARPRISPRGVAKTYELLLWYADASAPVTPEIKNILAQHPMLGYADPAFATRAGLPSPASPLDPERFPLLEGALDRAFDWITLERPWHNDFGTWNYGDIQWAWWGNKGFATYRYWMNHGKGWSIVPWVLWLRSGGRKYWENGEINSRHVMDVDTCHVPEWQRAGDGKLRGGQYHYCAIHWGYGPHVSTFFVDSEYLPYCYYATGYERARDVMLDRVEALARDRWQDRAAYFKQNREKRSRHLYVLVKDLSVLYESTWDERLTPYLKAYLELTLDAQEPNGMFMNIKSSHYLDQPLNIALGVLSEEKARIVQALVGWEAFLGNAGKARTGSAAMGPSSLWTLCTLANETGNPFYLETAAQVARARAWCIADETNEWNGMAPFAAHVAGPTLRDWVTVMAALSKRPPDQGKQAMAPLLHFNGWLPLTKAQKEAGWSGRHLALVLGEEGRKFRVDFHFVLNGMGHKLKSVHVRVYAPDGTVVAEKARDTILHLTDSSAIQGFDVDIPATGQPGVYVVEVWSRNGAPPVCVQSTTGRVVHYMPPGHRAVCTGQQVWGGRAWFVPEGAQEVLIDYPTDNPVGRIVAFDPEGEVVATSRITGTRIVENGRGIRCFPQTEPCRFTPGSGKSGLYSFVYSNLKWSMRHELRGMKPYLAVRKEEWFDPTQYLCPDLEHLLKASEAPQAG